MLRVVVAVLVAGGLLAVALPVVDDASRDHSHAATAAAVDRITTAATRLARDSDPTVAGHPGATRTITVQLPEAGWAHAGVTRLELVGDSEAAAREQARFCWTVDGTHRSRAPEVALRPAGGTLTLGPGSHRLRLRLDRTSNGRVVTVARV